jgi:hypothetical protein
LGCGFGCGFGGGFGCGFGLFCVINSIVWSSRRGVLLL